MSDLVWTDEPPTQPGWYWWNLRGTVVIQFFSREMIVEIKSGHYCPKGRWSGPIPEPREA